jgi:hypothetical protein
MGAMVIPNRARVVAVISALVLAVGLLALALLTKPAQAQSQGAVSEQFPLDFPIDARCAGEWIQVTGTIHTVNHFTLQDDGTYHGTSHFNFTGVKGVGLTSGDTYVIPSTSAYADNFGQPGQTVSGTVDLNLVIGKGKTPNQVGLVRLHYIVSPEGEIKVESFNFHSECHQEPEDEAGSGA